MRGERKILSWFKNTYKYWTGMYTHQSLLSNQSLLFILENGPLQLFPTFFATVLIMNLWFFDVINTSGVFLLFVALLWSPLYNIFGLLFFTHSSNLFRQILYVTYYFSCNVYYTCSLSFLYISFSYRIKIYPVLRFVLRFFAF